MVASYYAWDPEFDCITKETDTTGAVTARYTQEPKPYGGLISQHRSGASSFYHYDAIGTTRALTNSSQATTDTAAYTAFGEKVASVGSTTNPFGFVGAVGYHTNSANDHLYVRAREYQASLTRWLSKDPVETSSHRRSPYVYAMCNPVVLIDPSGLYTVDTQMDAFIPHDWLMLDPQSWVKGDNRDVSATPLGLESHRMLQTASVEMEECLQADPKMAEFSGINYSHMITYNFIGGYRLMLREKGTLTASIVISRTGPCDVQINMRAHGTIPFIFAPFAPAIDWDVVFKLHFREMVTGG